jgi:hypothetical protein
MALPPFLQKVLDWLHAGYPSGIPEQDYFPLLAFMARSLKPDEVSLVVGTLETESGADHPTNTQDVRVAIEEVTQSPALAQDVKRVEARLRDLGWEPEPAGDR